MGRAEPSPQTAASTCSETHRNALKDPSLDGMCDSDTSQAEPGAAPTPWLGSALCCQLLSPPLYLTFPLPRGFPEASPAPVIINNPQQ